MRTRKWNLGVGVEEMFGDCLGYLGCDWLSRIFLAVRGCVGTTGAYSVQLNGKMPGCGSGAEERGNSMREYVSCPCPDDQVSLGICGLDASR